MASSAGGSRGASGQIQFGSKIECQTPLSLWYNSPTHSNQHFKMSSNVSLIISELQATRAEVVALKAEVSSLRASLSKAPVSSSGEKAAKAKKAKKEPKPDAEPRAPTAWRLFSDRVRGLLEKEGYTGKDLSTLGLQFCSSLKEENADFESWSDSDILARRAAWVAPETSKAKAKAGSAAASVASGDAELEEQLSESKPAKKPRKNPWEGLSEEERKAKIAKMQAGRGKKDSESAGAPSSPPLVAKNEAAPPSPKAALPPPVPSFAGSAASASEAEAAVEFRPVMLNSKRFFVNLANGHAYTRNPDGSQGAWAGIFSKTGGPKGGPWIDDSVAEPGAEESEELNFDE